MKFIINPIFIFIFIWIIMLVFWSLNIAYFFKEYYTLAFFLCLISIIFFSIGYFLIYLINNSFIIKEEKFLCILNKKKVNIFVFILLLLSIGVVILNFILYGLPPFFKFFGYYTIDYLHYGKFKNLLFANLIFLFVISYFYKNIFISLFLKIFSLFILILYVSRGNIIFMVLFYMFLVLTDKRIKIYKIFIILLFLFIGVILLFQIIGEFRTGNEIFYNVMEIKDKYRIKNAGIIWIIAYMSMPFENLLEFIHHNIPMFLGENILSRSLPAFLSFNQNALSIYKNLLPNPYNTVPTYLGWIFFDFNWLGIIIFNFLIGLVSGYIFFIKKNKLFLSLLLTCIFLIFFNDYFFFFMTIIIGIYVCIFNRFLIKRIKIG